MSKRFDRLAARRAELVAQSDRNRAALADSFSIVENRLAMVERVVNIVRRVHRYRWIAGALAIGFALAGRKSRPRLNRAMQFLPIALELFRGFRSRRQQDSA